MHIVTCYISVYQDISKIELPHQMVKNSSCLRRHDVIMSGVPCVYHNSIVTFAYNINNTEFYWTHWQQIHNKFRKKNMIQKSNARLRHACIATPLTSYSQKWTVPSYISCPVLLAMKAEVLNLLWLSDKSDRLALAATAAMQIWAIAITQTEY